MATRSIGLVITEHIAGGAVRDHRIVGDLLLRPGGDESFDMLLGMPAEEMVRVLADQILALADSDEIEAVGLAFPGIIRGGIIEDSPNLQQLTGLKAETAMRDALAGHGIKAKIAISNDADAVAAGLAATQAGLDRLVRVWTLGTGIGFGHYPVADGVWEGGHTVVSLDPNENFCGCGGRGHLEGIMGHRAMRLRFLDREPDEIFAAAKTGEDPRCAEFAILWHRALAAATATSIHLEGPGKFFITGSNARFVNLQFLNRCVQEMVRLSPLQNFVLEIVPRTDEVAVIGAAVNARRS
jgi:glucokinase